jgi:hypothetical protein
MVPRRKYVWWVVLAALGVGACIAQFPPMGQRPPRQPRAGEYGPFPPEPPPYVDEGGSLVRGEGGILIDETTVKTAREVASHSTGTPEWKNPPGFEKDVFTFARILFRSTGNPGVNAQGWGRGRHLNWWVDFPDADLNFSYRTQQLTSIRTDPDGRVLRLSDPQLTHFPMIIMEHPGYIGLNETETVALRNYLKNGGFLLVSDFWSQLEWDGFAKEMNKVIPGQPWVEITTEHPIFHCVFDLKGPLQQMQVPTMQFWNPEHNPNDPTSPPLQKVNRGPGSEKMSIRAWLDEKGRMMALVMHNTDVPDGWEREGEDDRYFRTFSEKISYPLGLNILFYQMTH